MNLVDIIFIITMAAPQFVRSNQVGESSIRAVLLLFRHGDRAPLAPFPNDIHKKHSWPGGYGALSPKGVSQMYKSGLLKARRYASLLGKSCDQQCASSKVLLQSSHTKRCVDSAISFLEGFMPGEWPPSIVNVIPAQDDEILAIFPSKRCPKYDDTLWNAFKPGDCEVNELVGDEGKFVEFLAEKTGLNSTELRRFYFISDSFKVHLDNELALPNWAKPIYESKLEPLGKIIFNKWGHTDRMHARSGALLKDMLDKLDSFKNEGKRNIFLYSGHDLTISALLIHLEVIDQATIIPSYSATLAIELHEYEDSQDDYEVKLFYFRDFNDEDPIQIKLPGCEEPCSFEYFKAMMFPKLILDYENFCKM